MLKLKIKIYQGGDQFFSINFLYKNLQSYNKMSKDSSGIIKKRLKKSL